MVQLSKIQEGRSEKEQRLLQRKAKLESDLARLRDQEKKATRKDDTRRKIVLGGALLKAMESGTISDEVGRKLVSRFVGERDHKLFEGSPLAAVVTGAESTVQEAPDSDMRE